MRVRERKDRLGVGGGGCQQARVESKKSSHLVANRKPMKIGIIT